MPEVVDNPDWEPGDPIYPVEHHVIRNWMRCRNDNCRTEWTGDSHILVCPKCNTMGKPIIRRD